MYKLILGADQAVVRTPHTSRYWQKVSGEEKWETHPKYFGTYRVTDSETSKEELFDVMFSLSSIDRGCDYVYSMWERNYDVWCLYAGEDTMNVNHMSSSRIASLAAKRDLMNGEWWPFLLRN